MTTNQQKEQRKQNYKQQRTCQQRKHNWSNIIIVPDEELEGKDNPMKK